MNEPLLTTWREMLVAKAATSEWPVERLRKFCRLWDAGVPVLAIAAELGVSHNAIVGKKYKLARRGIIISRPSPFTSQRPRVEPAPVVEAPIPRPLPPPRAQPLPPGARTLPPLPSELREGLSP